MQVISQLNGFSSLGELGDNSALTLRFQNLQHDIKHNRDVESVQVKPRHQPPLDPRSE